MGKKGKRKRSKPELRLRLRVMTMKDLAEAVQRGEITGQPLPRELAGIAERFWLASKGCPRYSGVDWARPGTESVGVEQAEPTDQTDQTDPVATPEEEARLAPMLEAVSQATFNRRLASALRDPDIADAVADALVRRAHRIDQDMAEGVAENLAESMAADQ